MELEEKLLKWRLILGSKADPNQGAKLEQEDQVGMDGVLEALYDTERKGGLGPSSPNINRWLGDIRKYFPSSTVQIMQKDALERLQLTQMLLEPELLESIEADVQLVATLLSLNKVLSEKTRATARQVIEKVVRKLEKKLREPLRSAIKGSLNQAVRNYRPKLNEIDWHRTIRTNLRHYQEDLKAIIPERLVGYGNKRQQLKHIILLVDQSGSMATSVVYSSIMAAILASLRSIKTHVIAFDTSIADLTERLPDPVDLLFASQLGGGTDIQNALTYARKLIHKPADTILLLISDLFEGGNIQEMMKTVGEVKHSGVNFISLLALTDQGMPAYDKNVATKLAGLGIPAFGCTPDLFPSLMAAAIKKSDLRQWAAGNQVVVRN